LDSLRAQEGVRVDLHVRDDGSSEATLAVLARFAEAWPELAKVQSGPNLKPAASFLELLQTAPPDADFYAFSDQDDVWLPQKLARATDALAADNKAQHRANSLGADVSLAVQTVRQAGLLFRKRRDYWPIHRQTSEFLRRFVSELKLDDRALVEALTRVGGVSHAATGDTMRAPVDRRVHFSTVR
jgi:glycosyltransferase involved in cell wall biosynthesis